MSSPAPTLQLGPIGQIAIPVTNLERAVAFYRDSLDLKFLFQVPNLAFFDCGGVRLMLDIPEDSGERRSSVIYFKVSQIEEAFQALSSRGVAFEGKPHLIARMPDHELWMAFFRDPDLNLHALMSEVRPA
ncbi:MAG TPA: VOC family protein [Candidatus Acidoferrales bacterium]|nr:VOC family protein [Candidatus Acidoferrales bacterium]